MKNKTSRKEIIKNGLQSYKMKDTNGYIIVLSLAIRKKKMQTAWSLHYTSIKRLSHNQRRRNTKEDVEKEEPLFTIGGSDN